MPDRELGEISLAYEGDYLVASRQGEEIARFRDVSDPHDYDSTNPAYLAFLDGVMRRFPDASIFMENTGTYVYSMGSLYYQRENRWETDDERAERMANGRGVGAFVPLQGAPRYFR
ncbi:hypothetical protein [Rhizobium leguminosarum]|uniref:hypothetical protein n=1 Tax=Rhizobium leguminosarum TaxID=384 RepID=UPI002E0DB678|nr:hypothetical protein U8Q02_41095 [Rhizobium leguminosarum]